MCPVKCVPVTLPAVKRVSDTKQISERSLNLKWFVTLSEMLSIKLADLPGNTNEVYGYIYRCSPMPYEFFWVFGVQFEALSQTYVSGTLISHTGCCPENDSQGGSSSYYF